MSSSWQPYREPLSTTLARTGAIAVLLGALLARLSGGGLARWPLATLLMLWPSLGGHFVELWFLNWLRPRLAPARLVQIGARLAVWFVGGMLLAFAMVVTASAAGRAFPAPWVRWWIPGLAFIGIELVAQLALRLRGRANFYDGRG